MNLVEKNINGLPNCEEDIRHETKRRRICLLLYSTFFITVACYLNSLGDPDLSSGKMLLSWKVFAMTRTGKYSPLFRCLNFICFIVYCYSFTFFIIYLVHTFHYQSIYSRIMIEQILKNLRKENQKEEVVFENIKKLSNFINLRRR